MAPAENCAAEARVAVPERRDGEGHRDISRRVDEKKRVATPVKTRAAAVKCVEIVTSEIMPIVKAKREAVGQEVWTKDVAMSFGDLLKAVRSAGAQRAEEGKQ